MSYRIKGVCAFYCAVVLMGVPSLVESLKLINVSLKKPTQISHPRPFRDAFRAVDGSRHKNPRTAPNCTVSVANVGGVTHRWWMVDLLQSHNISSLKITTRAMATNLLKKLIIYITQERPFFTGTTLGVSHEICTTLPEAQDPGKTKNHPCMNVTTGRYVVISQDGDEDDVLSLCEVEVLAEIPDPVSVQQRRFATFKMKRSTQVPFLYIPGVKSLCECLRKCQKGSQYYVTTVAQFCEQSLDCECIQASQLDVFTVLDDPKWALMSAWDNSFEPIDEP